MAGGAVGLAAGARGGWIDSVLMRVTDVFLALPAALLAIVVVTALGPSLFHLLVALSIFWWPYYARIVRSEIRANAALPYVEAATLSGTSRLRIAFRHLLPSAIPVTIVAREPLTSGRSCSSWPHSRFSASEPRRPLPSWARWSLGRVRTASELLVARDHPGRRRSCAQLGWKSRWRRNSRHGGRAMTGFAIRRIGAALIVGLALIAVIFVLQEASDFDPVRAKLGPNATNEIVEAERERLGYDDPLPFALRQLRGGCCKKEISALPCARISLSLKTP